jgi:hypothetical protein
MRGRSSVFFGFFVGETIVFTRNDEVFENTALNEWDS